MQATEKLQPHNCEPCRRARTKCDRTAPVCRRCSRLGLHCVGGSGPKPRRGRPRQTLASKPLKGSSVGDGDGGGISKSNGSADTSTSEVSAACDLLEVDVAAAHVLCQRGKKRRVGEQQALPKPPLPRPPKQHQKRARTSKEVQTDRRQSHAGHGHGHRGVGHGRSDGHSRGHGHSHAHDTQQSRARSHNLANAAAVAGTGSRVKVKSSTGKGMTPCRQMQLAILSVIIDQQNHCHDSDHHTVLRSAICAHIAQWVWTALMRGSLYLLSEVIHLCKSCRLPFHLIDDVLNAHHRPNPPIVWQTLSIDACVKLCPAAHVHSWQSDPGFVLAFSTFYGRRFYIGSENMAMFMSADRANKLWIENRKNIMSCFVESTSNVVKTEAWLITHPTESLNHVFSVLHEDNRVSKASNAVEKSSTVALSASASAPSTLPGVPSFKSEGYTSPLVVFDIWNQRYNCVAHITLINSLCGAFRTEVLRLCPLQNGVGGSGTGSTPTHVPKSSKSTLLKGALLAKDKAAAFCQGFGFLPILSATMQPGGFGNTGENDISDGVNDVMPGAANTPVGATPAQQSFLSSTDHPDDVVDNLWELYMQDFENEIENSSAGSESVFVGRDRGDSFRLEAPVSPSHAHESRSRDFYDF